jgi:hypothetical protein
VNAEASLIALGDSFRFASSLASNERLVFDLSPCEVFGAHADLFRNCRVKASISVKDNYQLTTWSSLSAGVQVAAASKEDNTLSSLLHPSILLEMAPHKLLDFGVGFSSSLRWPTLLEKNAYFGSLVGAGSIAALPLASEKLRLAILRARARLPLDYAHISLDAQVKTGWIQDVISLNRNSVDGLAFVNRGVQRYSEFAAQLLAELSAGNQLYFASEVHSPSAFVPDYRIVLGARLALGAFGSFHVETQSPLGVNLFYQTRPIADHIVLEARGQHILSRSEIFLDMRIFL